MTFLIDMSWPYFAVYKCIQNIYFNRRYIHASSEYDIAYFTAHAYDTIDEQARPPKSQYSDERFPYRVPVNVDRQENDYEGIDMSYIQIIG